MKAFLEGFLPRIVPAEIPFDIIAHEGKSDLEKSIPRKLRAWREPNVRFVVIRDQDNGDCMDVKRRLKVLCKQGGRPQTLVRVACRELEAWFLGDLGAVAKVFDDPKIAGLAKKSKFRGPDRLGSPSRELEMLIPGYGKVRGARAMGPDIDIERCTSTSFGQFHIGLTRMLKVSRGDAV